MGRVRQLDQQTIFQALTRWACEQASRGVPMRTLLLPWQSNSLHTAPGVWSRALAGLLSKQAKEPNSNAVVPLLVDAVELSNQNIDKVYPFLAAKAGFDDHNTYRRIPFYSHLKNGTVLLILSGLTDMEIDLKAESCKEILDEEGVKKVLEILTHLGARAVTLARGSDKSRMYYPHKRALESAGFQAEWLLPEATSSGPSRYPTEDSQYQTLFGEKGHALTRVLPLSRFASESEQQREAAVYSFFFFKGLEEYSQRRRDEPVEEHKEHLPTPKLEITFKASGARAMQGDWKANDFNQWLLPTDKSLDSGGPDAHRHLILLDDIAARRIGGQGKTTQMLAVLMDAYVGCRPALYLNVNELRGDKAAKQEANFLDMALRFRDMYFDERLGSDKAVRLHLLESGVTLILDGLDEAPAGEPMNWLLKVLESAIGADSIAGVQIILASRASEWRDQAKSSSNPEPPIAAQLREKLQNYRESYLELIANPPKTEEAWAYLGKENPELSTVLIGKPIGALITHPLTLGLLCALNVTSTIDVGKSLEFWRLVDIIMRQNLEKGIAKLTQDGQTPLFDVEEGEEYIRQVSLAMVQQGTPLPRARALETIVEAARPPRIAYKPRNPLRAQAHQDQLWKAAAEAILAQLCRAYPILVRNPEDGSVSVAQDAFRDVAASQCLQNLRNLYSGTKYMLAQTWWHDRALLSTLALDYARKRKSVSDIGPDEPAVFQAYAAYLSDEVVKQKIEAQIRFLYKRNAKADKTKISRITGWLTAAAPRLHVIAPTEYMVWISKLLEVNELDTALLIRKGGASLLTKANEDGCLDGWIERLDKCKDKSVPGVVKRIRSILTELQAGNHSLEETPAASPNASDLDPASVNDLLDGLELSSQESSPDPVARLKEAAGKCPDQIITRLGSALDSKEREKRREAAKILPHIAPELAARNPAGLIEIIGKIMSSTTLRAEDVLVGGKAISVIAPYMVEQPDRREMLLGWLDTLLNKDSSKLGNAYSTVRDSIQALSEDERMGWFEGQLKSANSGKRVRVLNVLLSRTIASTMPRSHFLLLVAQLSHKQ